MNVRDPTARSSSQSCTGDLISLTTGKRLVFESRGELDLILLLDVDYRTVNLATQPETFLLTRSGSARSYTPDLFSRDVYDVSAFWDVKRGDRLEADPEFAGRRSEIKAECCARGAHFRATPRELLRPGNRLANAYRIYAAASVRDPLADQRVSQILSRQASGVDLATLRAAGLDPRLHAALIGMIGHREVAIDMAVGVDDERLEFHW